MITDAIPTSFLQHLGLDLFFLFVLLYGVYARFRSHGKLALTFVMLNMVTFSLTFLLNRVPMDVGFGLGLFAIFGILRYRTKPLAIDELTYVFIAIGLAVVNAIEHASISMEEVVLLDIAFVVLPLALEWQQRRRGDITLQVRYDRVDLLAQEHRAALIQDLEDRLFIRADSIEVSSINLKRETAELVVHVKGQQLKRGEVTITPSASVPAFTVQRGAPHPTKA